jgi:hypothetical protein
MIYIISLEESTDRLNPLIEKLRGMNIFSYKIVRPVEVEEEVENPSEGWNKQALSLKLTTISIIEEAMEKGYPYIHIFEDDSIIDEKNYLKYITNFNKFINKGLGWDFIHLNWSNGNRFSLESVCGFGRTLDGVLCCQSYVINKDVYQVYLDLLLKHNVPIDEITKHIHKHRKRSFVVYEKPVIHEKGKYSTIRQKIVNY